MAFSFRPLDLALIKDTKPLGEVDVAAYDAVFLVGGQGPMYTYYNDPWVHVALGV